MCDSFSPTSSDFKLRPTSGLGLGKQFTNPNRMLSFVFRGEGVVGTRKGVDSRQHPDFRKGSLKK